MTYRTTCSKIKQGGDSIYIVRVGIRKDATWSYQLKKFKPGELGAWIEEQFRVPGVERITLTNFMEE